MNTKAQILSVTSDLLQRQTVNGFSLQDIADRVGIRKASLFHYYRNKEALVADVLENSLNELRKRVESMRAQPAQRQLDAFLDIYQRHIGAGSRLCPVSGVTGDWDHLGAEPRRWALALLNEQYTWLMKIAELGGFTQAPAETERWAEQIMVRIQGAMLLSRIQSSPLPLERTIAQLRSEWKTISTL
ncbi:TetR/AcrR family transcriptional regulator [uncultured Halopseudomonas sp.]|uniref:TetR/AcrR family transcriptional regulator n=1 Tax=uncultured Halopseudomonas sp. TaxID=2901193 RepID=UPI0030EE1279|tara:strand:+ start:31043 stop:31603 length:561 start_codon:yes stop_codon:yes gene_type:complete